MRAPAARSKLEMVAVGSGDVACCAANLSDTWDLVGGPRWREFDLQPFCRKRDSREIKDLQDAKQHATHCGANWRTQFRDFRRKLRVSRFAPRRVAPIAGRPPRPQDDEPMK